jgi:hypothetical protein
MKTIKPFSFFLVAVLFAFAISCAKEYPVAQGGEDTVHFLAAQNAPLPPAMVNGMLHFDSYSAFESYVQTMAEMEADTNEVRDAYIELGISPDTDSLSSEEEARDYIHSFTFNPVCKLYEDRVPGFVSARSKEEAAIKLGMLEGEDEFDSLIDDPYLKSALNEYDAVHIGTRIFKFF